MKSLLASLLLALLLAACSGKEPHPAAIGLQIVEPFRMTYYDTTQPQIEHDGGTVPNIAFAFAYKYRQIEGQNLRVRWQGKISLPKEDNIIVQYSSARIRLQIDGKEMAIGDGFSTVALGKGEHTVEVEYEPKWHADELIVNFLPSSAQPVLPQQAASDVQADGRDEVRYIVLNRDSGPKISGDSTREEIEAALDFSPPPVATMPIPAGDDQILILAADKPLNVVLQPQEGADIKAVVASPFIGTVQGTNAPVYRLTEMPYGLEFPHNCQCVGGTELICSTGAGENNGRGNYDAVKALSQTLSGKIPDFFYFQQKWHSAVEIDAISKQLLAKYQDDKARCGGSRALRFDNAIAGGQGNRSWFSQIGGSVPDQGFMAYYFTQNNIGQPVFSKQVSHIAINYPYDEFHGISAENFAALWVGKIRLAEDTVLDMQYDLSMAQLRVWVDGRIVHQYWHHPGSKNQSSNESRFELLLPRGEHRLEVEYINHWHTVGFAMHPQRKLLQPQDGEVRALLDNPAYTVVHASVYESGNQDSTLPLELPPVGKPVVLVLKSHNSVFWQIRSGGMPLQAVVIEDGKGLVQGAGVPVYRVRSLPNAANWRFYQYSSTRISAGEYEAR